MRVLATLLAILPTIAAAQAAPCAFVVGHATVGSGGLPDSGFPKPEWFIVSGRAELVVKGRVVEARLFDSRGTDISHRLRGTLASVSVNRRKGQTSILATSRTFGSDAGDEPLSGTFLAATGNADGGKYLSRSFLAHNGSTFVGVTCHEKSAT